MDELDKRIESLRIELEKLYIRIRAGEAGLEEAVRVSGDLDRLILEKASLASAARRAADS